MTQHSKTHKTPKSPFLQLLGIVDDIMESLGKDRQSAIDILQGVLDEMKRIYQCKPE